MQPYIVPSSASTFTWIAGLNNSRLSQFPKYLPHTRYPQSDPSLWNVDFLHREELSAILATDTMSRLTKARPQRRNPAGLVKFYLAIHMLSRG